MGGFLTWGKKDGACNVSEGSAVLYHRFSLSYRQRLPDGNKNQV